MTGTYSAGNAKPWYHRLPEHTAMLVHAGLPSEGASVVVERAKRAKTRHGMLMFGSVGPANKEYKGDALEGMVHDCMLAFDEVNASDAFAGIEINISCPNLKFGEPFANAGNVDILLDELAKKPHGKPVFVKCQSMMTATDIIPIMDAIASYGFVDAVSVCNLRKDRTGLGIPNGWLGNISGLPAQECNEDIIRLVRKEYGDRFVINGIGGTMTPDDALRKMDEGADLVSGITTFMYHGPQVMAEWKRALVRKETTGAI